MKKLLLLVALSVLASCGDDGVGEDNEKTAWTTFCLDYHTKVIVGPYYKDVRIVEVCP